MTCPYEDHDIDVLTNGRCTYCGGETVKYDPAKTIAALNEFHPIGVTTYATEGILAVLNGNAEPETLDDDEGVVYSATEACRCGQVHPC